MTGAGEGIGAAAAAQLGARGFAVGLAARRPMGLVAVQNRVREAGGYAFTAPTDVTDEVQVKELVEQTERRLGPVAVLINAAGAVHRGPLVSTAEADFERMLDVNLKGVFRCVKAVLPGMIQRRKGRIVNLAAMAGRIGVPQLSAYGAAKWGVVGFTRACAAELRGFGISAFVVCPGSVDSPAYRAAMPGVPPRAQPDAVAEAVTWLASDAPDAMTGAVVEVPG